MELFSAHTFRHTFATRAFESGIKPKTIQKYLGHATLQTTMDLYTEVLKEYQVEEMDKLNDVLEKISLSSDDIAEHRLVYQVYEEPFIENDKQYKGTIKIIRMWTHYEDVK